MVVGVVVGVFFGLIIIPGLVCYLCGRRRSNGVGQGLNQQQGSGNGQELDVLPNRTQDVPDESPPPYPEPTAQEGRRSSSAESLAVSTTESLTDSTVESLAISFEEGLAISLAEGLSKSSGEGLTIAINLVVE